MCWQLFNIWHYDTGGALVVITKEKNNNTVSLDLGS